MADNKNFMWANLVHLGSNMWNEEGNTAGREHRSTPCASPVFLFNRECWDGHMQELKDSGVNTLIVDVGEAMRYESHPEIAVEGAWDHDQMRSEVLKLQGMGFEVVPKLNFSSCHDIWLKEYSRMLSTPIYYQVCKDIIAEVCEVFKPKYFHLGMDEENYGNQKRFQYAVVRHGDLWWHDFYFYLDCVEKAGARSWVWSDYAWNHPDIFLEKMPRDVIQSNWYYSAKMYPSDEGFTEAQANWLAMFELFDKHGFDQVPTGSVWAADDNFERLTEYCADRISSDKFMGMMQTTWERIDPDWMHVHHKAANSIRNARNLLENR